MTSFRSLNLTLELVLVGGFYQADSGFPRPASYTGGHRPAPRRPARENPESSRLGENVAGVQTASSRPVPSPAPGALTTGEQEAERRSPAVLSSHEAGSTEERQGGTLWRFCGSVTPPMGTWANRCPVLSAEELLPFLWGRVSKKLPSAAAHVEKELGAPLCRWVEAGTRGGVSSPEL